MILVHHRINTVAQLAEVPRDRGIELDVRYHEDALVLAHDPFGHHVSRPEPFEDLLAAWRHDGPMILNVKTEGIERACIELMVRHGVRRWFFLDLSMPYFVAYALKAAAGEIPGFGPENLAVRFSEHEAIEYALGFAGKARWVWVDCFTQMPLDDRAHRALREAGFRVCLVSPELQKHPVDRIREFRRQLGTREVEAVCTKRPDLWTAPLAPEGAHG